MSQGPKIPVYKPLSDSLMERLANAKVDQPLVTGGMPQPVENINGLSDTAEKTKKEIKNLKEELRKLKNLLMDYKAQISFQNDVILQLRQNKK